MKTVTRIGLSLTLAVVGFAMAACTSYVKTYDANGNLLGSCGASRGWFLGIGGGTNCVGSANPKDQK
ncbi:MAG: hypothetical protein HY403_05970 [Elusimicrobia bacterium]|nr:hypothetical protein [Elusimicrobiota bacterium]